MKVYSLEYEKWLRDPRISEAVDNCELSTLYQWLWETMKDGRSYQSYGLHDGEQAEGTEHVGSSTRDGSTQGED
tara:strand:+ start:393 stop:614 length:222 start_codon:yes stop_codon:yes gene_type:complete